MHDLYKLALRLEDAADKANNEIHELRREIELYVIQHERNQPPQEVEEQ